jgi:hypothetical protein
MTESPVRYVYRLDASDRITYVNAEWLRFAADSEAPELTEEAVLGQPVWWFVSGAETRTLYEALHAGLRDRRSEIAIPFHCDSPSLIRRMSLRMRSMPGGGIECEGALQSTEARDPVALLSRSAARDERSVPICSLCRRLLAQDQWVDARAAITRLQLFARPQCPPSRRRSARHASSCRRRQRAPRWGQSSAGGTCRSDTSGAGRQVPRGMQAGRFHPPATRACDPRGGLDSARTGCPRLGEKSVLADGQWLLAPDAREVRMPSDTDAVIPAQAGNHVDVGIVPGHDARDRPAGFPPARE